MTNALDSTDVGRPAGMGVLVATCVSTLGRQRQHIGGDDPAPGDRGGRRTRRSAPCSGPSPATRSSAPRSSSPRARWATSSVAARCSSAACCCSSPRVPSSPCRPAGRCDRRAAAIQGAAGSHDPRLGPEPADRGLLRIRTNAGGVAVGRGVRRRSRGRPARRWVARRLDGLAGLLLDRRRDRGSLHPCDASIDRGVARSEPPAFDRLVRHRAGGHDPGAADPGGDEGIRVGLDMGRSCCACWSRSSR